MKRVVLFIVALLTWCSVYAQRSYDTHRQEFHFVYIGHDVDTPILETMEQMDWLYENALQYPEDYAVVFYLPNDTDPIVVCVNTPNENPEDYENVLKRELILRRAHNVVSSVDVEEISKIINNVDIVDSNGHHLYERVVWTYYITPSFWRMLYNERVIAALYWVLDMEPLVNSNYLTLNVMMGRDLLPMYYNEEYPFGFKGLCGSYDLSLMPY